MIRSLLLASVALILSESPAHSEEPNQAMVGPKNGSLVIMGGGGKDRTFPQVFAHFIKLAGGKDAVELAAPVRDAHVQPMVLPIPIHPDARLFG